MPTETDDLPIRTATMAKIFAQQGYYDKAIDIYRRLLKKDPDRQDLAEALARTESKRNIAAASAPGDLVSVLSEYIRFLIDYRQLLDLQALQRRAASKNRSE
jgi:tetratricopeptide (TPR) repeat protein